MPWSVKFTWPITKEPLGKILNLFAEGMGWSPFCPAAHAIWGAGWPLALQWKIPDSPWVTVKSLGVWVIVVGTVGLRNRKNDSIIMISDQFPLINSGLKWAVTMLFLAIPKFRRRLIYMKLCLWIHLCITLLNLRTSLNSMFQAGHWATLSPSW